MLEEMHGYKVIKRDTRESARASAWGLMYSPTIRAWGLMYSKWIIHYPANVEVKPKVQGSKLFFFKDREDAVRFMAYDEVIVPCIAKGVTKPVTICSSVYSVGRFWKNRYTPKTSLIPKGTYMAESITCLE